MNTEKIEKLKKGLTNSQISDSIKVKIQEQIDRLEKEDANEVAVLKQESENPAIEKEVETPVVEQKIVTPKKATKTVPKKTTKTVSKRQPKKVLQPKTVESKGKENNIMSVTKSIQKQGESWKDALERAKQVLAEKKTETVKEKESELKKLLALIRRRKDLKGLSGRTNIMRDLKRDALPSGKRFPNPDNKNTQHPERAYYENRPNRTDNFTVGKYKLEDGGGVDNDDDERFVKTITAQFNHIISLKTLSEKREPIQNILNNIDDYAGSVIQKRITADNLKYALTQITVSSINNVLKTSLSALNKGDSYAEGGSLPFMTDPNFGNFQNTGAFADGGKVEDLQNQIAHWKNLLSNIDKYPKYNAKNVEQVIRELEYRLDENGKVKQIVDAIFEFNEKRGKLNTSFGAKTKEGLTALIENDNYSSEEIAKAIFYSNVKKEYISTGWGDKTFYGLQDMIERARGKEYAKGGALYEKGKNYPVKTIPASDCDKYGLDEFPNFSKTGSISGMKKLYYGKDALLVKCGNYIYNVTSQPEIYFNGAYELGGSFAPNVSNGTQFMDGVYAKGGSVSEDISECKKLVSAFCKEFGDKFGLNEEAILEKVKFRDYLGNGASVFVSLSVTSNVEDLKVGETRPTGGYIIFTSDINPNGVTGKDDIARTYSVDIEIKGVKRYTQRKTEEGRYFKSYNYGRTIEEAMDKTDTKIIYDLYPLEKKDDLKFKMSSLFADGGSFAPNVSNGTQFMDGVYADGGLLVNNSTDLEEVAKYMTNAVKKHRADLKDLIYYFEKENNFDYKYRVKIWDEMNGYEMRKTYENILQMLTRIVEANGKKFNNGGSFAPNVSNGTQFMDGVYADGGSIQKVPARIKKRLEELKEEIREERISYGEIIELESLKEYIDPSDVELLEWAGVPEFEDEDEDDDKKYAKGGEIPFENSNLHLVGEGLDINGNHIVKVSFPNQRAFSIQTNGVLRNTNRILKSVDGIKTLSPEDVNAIELEVVEYVSEFGSDKQKKSLKTYFAKGGKIKANYIPKEDIDSITTNYGQIIDGDKLLDGAYTKAKLIKPVMSRTQFEDESYEYAKGGAVNEYYKGMTKEGIISKTIVYDNEKSLDRYTVFTPDGSVFAMSETAQGFNQYVGEDTEIKKGKHLGKKLASVPKDIEWAILDRMKEEYANGGSVGDVSGNYYSSTDFVSQNDLMDLAKSTFGQDWESGGDYDYDTEEIKMLVKKLGGGYKIVYVDSEQREKFENAKSKYLPLLKNKSNDGDIFVIPNKKMANGGFTPDVSNGTQFMSGVYADGGKIGYKSELNNIISELNKNKLTSEKVKHFDGYLTTSIKKENEEVRYLAKWMMANDFNSSIINEGEFIELGFTYTGTKQQFRDKLIELSDIMKNNNISGNMEFDEIDADEADDYLYAKGGSVNSSEKLENGVYRVGKPTKVSPILYEQKIVEIFANGDISTASDYGRKLADFKHQKYPIITKEQLQAQYKMAKGGSVNSSEVDELWNGYASAVLFTETDSDSGEPLDSEFSISDFDEETVNSSKEMLAEYYSKNKDAIEESGLDLDTIGNDIWYTRSGQGAGFFDHSLDEEVEEKLTKGAKALGEYPSVETYDGKISVRGGRVFANGGVMAKGGMIVYLDGEKANSFKTKKALYEFVRSQANTGVKKVEIDYGNRIIPTFDTYLIEEGKLIHKGELIQKDYNKEEAEKRRVETERSLNQMMGYANGGDTGKVIELFPLELVPLSTQLSKITGDQLSTGNYTDEKGKDYSTKSGNIIVHASTGQKFRIPERIYDYVDGYNLVINKANNAVIVYETNAKVADIIDGKLDFSKNDESVSIDTSKVVSEFEKGNIPSARNADEEYKKIERELENLYYKYDNSSEYKTSHTARALDSKIQDYQNIIHRLERKYADGGQVDNKFNYMMLSRLQQDCDYYLGYGGRSERSLWAGSVDGQIEEMKRLWNNLPKDGKPEWLSMEDILDYEKKMKNKYADGGSMFEAPIGIQREVKGKLINLPVTDEIYSSEINRFVDYVHDFYEETGFTKAEVKKAVNKYLAQLEFQQTWGGGDSVDRERVYEYLELEGIEKNYKNGLITRHEYEDMKKEYETKHGKKYADGGFLDSSQMDKLDNGFTIPQLSKMLNEMFPDSFKFEVFKREQSKTMLDYEYEDKVKDDKLILYFHEKSYDRDLNYEVRQGQENTYFKFLLSDDKSNAYIGTFGFKDEGDVDESYITKFTAFLYDAYHHSFEVKHSVMANGGSFAPNVSNGTQFMNGVYKFGGDINDLPKNWSYKVQQVGNKPNDNYFAEVLYNGERLFLELGEMGNTREDAEKEVKDFFATVKPLSIEEMEHSWGRNYYVHFKNKRGLGKKLVYTKAEAKDFFDALKDLSGKKNLIGLNKFSIRKYGYSESGRFYVIDENDNTINKKTGKVYSGKQTLEYVFNHKKDAQDFADKLNEESKKEDFDYYSFFYDQKSKQVKIEQGFVKNAILNGSKRDCEIAKKSYPKLKYKIGDTLETKSEGKANVVNLKMQIWANKEGYVSEYFVVYENHFRTHGGEKYKVTGVERIGTNDVYESEDYDKFDKGGELQGKFLAEIKVPYNFEYVVEDEYEFSRFLSKALTNKFNFGNGAWGIKIVKPLFEKDYGQKIVVEIDIPLGVTQGGGLDKFDVLEFISKTLTKKWFGNGVWGVEVINSYAKGGEIADIEKYKKALIAKAKTKGLYENFGQDEVRKLSDKYGYSPSVSNFDNWAMNFDLSSLKQYADGGEVKVPARIKKRLEELREEIREERISMGEIAELESLKDYIDPSDVELLQWAGVEEYPEDEDDDKYADGGELESAIKGYIDYTNKNWEGNGYFSKEYALKELAESELDLRKLNDGKITPRQVVGRGYKNGKKVALEYLESQIKYRKSIIGTNGLSNFVNFLNFRSHLVDAKKENLISEQKFNDLIKESEELSGHLHKSYANGGALPFMTDPNFGNFQNTVAFANGGSIGSGKNGYVAFYKGKKIDVYADTKYQAQKTASQHFKARKEYDVDVVLAELDGKPYINSTMFAKGGSTGMKAQQGQINDLKKYIPNANKENIEILAEAGNDNGETFRGSFIAKYGKQNFRIENAKLVRKFELGGENDGHTLNHSIEFTTSDEDSYLSGNVGGDMMDLIDVEKIGDNKYSAIAKSYSVAFEDIKGQELEDELYNQINEMFATNDDIDVDLESVKIVGKKFELGGAFMTDLAGHTGGSLGTGNPTPLSGFSGTNYTGLVGETGAMSSGELFKNGGNVEKFKWQDAEIGDSARVKELNRTGVIVKTYGRKFHLKFGNGTEKTFDASELEFIDDRDNYAEGGGVGKFNVGDKVKLDYISDSSKHNGEVGTITWLNNYNYYPKGDMSVIEKRTQGEITYSNGDVEQISDFNRKKSGLVSQIEKVKFAEGGVLYSAYTDNPLKYLSLMGATVHSDLNYSTSKNGVNYYVGFKKDKHGDNKAIVVAFIEDENNYMIDKEDAREMAETAREKGVDSVELYTNYGVELHTTSKTKSIGFDKIHKVVGKFENGGGVAQQEEYGSLIIKTSSNSELVDLKRLLKELNVRYDLDNHTIRINTSKDSMSETKYKKVLNSLKEMNFGNDIFEAGGGVEEKLFPYAVGKDFTKENSFEISPKEVEKYKSMGFDIEFVPRKDIDFLKKIQLADEKKLIQRKIDDEIRKNDKRTPIQKTKDEIKEIGLTFSPEIKKGVSLEWYYDVVDEDSGEVCSYAVENKIGYPIDEMSKDFLIKNDLLQKYEAGGVMAQNQQVINDASQSYVNYYLGEGASQGIYKEGGSIPNNYEGRTPEDIWNNWTISQKKHFLKDHLVLSGATEDHRASLYRYDELPKDLLSKIETKLTEHINESQYASGGLLESKMKTKLSENFSLPLQVAIYVPSTKDADEKVSQEEFHGRVGKVEEFVSSLFGGFSANDIDGGYMSHEKGLIKEDVYKVTSFAPKENFNEKMSQLVAQVKKWAKQWGQESIGLEFEGDLFYIEQSGSFAKGGSFDDNDGFMRMDNNRSFRYPEREVHVDTIDEPIDLTTNVDLRRRKVNVQTINDDIDLKDDNRVRAKLSYENKNRTPEKLMMVNQRMIITDFPTPTSKTHKND